jgi:hypothetical protein
MAIRDGPVELEVRHEWTQDYSTAIVVDGDADDHHDPDHEPDVAKSRP